MPCFKPITVPKHGYVDLKVTVACGRCIGCRIDKKLEWRSRLLDEAQMHDKKAFVTCTYDDAHLPRHGSLVKRHAQLWQKRLRAARPKEKVRFFTVGEYGEETKRPHYHALVFGTDFPDKRRHSKSGEHTLYVSDELNDLWGQGHCLIGTVTADSCAYVAAYVTKKLNGPLAEQRYSRLDPTTGEVVSIEPEFAIMSRNPGIGSAWYEKFKSDVFPSDTKVIKGRAGPVPDYYAKKLEREDEAQLLAIKERRRAAARKRRADSTPERLKVREEVAVAKIKRRKVAI